MSEWVVSFVGYSQVEFKAPFQKQFLTETVFGIKTPTVSKIFLFPFLFFLLIKKKNLFPSP